jgi:hypothetical protein
MARRHLLLAFALAVVVCLSAIPTSAEEVIETWWGDSFSQPLAVSVNPTDGSCWVADQAGGQTVHLAADGTELGRRDVAAICLSTNPTDGSCWLGTAWGEVIHLTADGSELLRIAGITDPVSIAVNATDGSCWVAVADFVSDTTYEVLHLAETGTVLSRTTSLNKPVAVSANPVDGSCWVVDGHFGYDDVVHLSQSGAELWRGEAPHRARWISVNPADGSFWVVGAYGVTHMAEDGAELWSRNSRGVWSVSVNPVDGSCWICDGDGVAHLAEDGAELWRGDIAGKWVSVNPADGSCWVADFDNGQVGRLEVVGYEGPRFPDVMPYHWAFEEIEACVEAGIVGGYLDGLYHPTTQVSRGQMSVFIARSLAGGDENVPDGECTEPPFTDVDCDHWARKYIAYCVDAGVVGGYLDGSYGPTGLVDRGQMSVFISRAVAGGDESVPDGPVDATFDDVPTDHWAYKYVEYCVDNAIVGGYDPVTYAPAVIVTRDQMAVFICRGFELPV